jgi:hypothetical protein
MKAMNLTARPRWFGLLAAAWMLLGTLLLVLFTVWNGSPLPASVPGQSLPFLGFVAVTGFVYLLPVWLVTKERQYANRRGERPSYGAYGLGVLTLLLLWSLLLSPWLLR